MPDTLPQRALDWVMDAVPGARAVRVLRSLPGATTSTLHAVEVDRADALPLGLVLRRYTDARVRASDPQYPRTEAAALRALAGAADVIAPRLVAVDESGTRCDVPAVLMTRLDGAPTLDPPDVDAWARGLAGALAAVHRLDGDGLDGEYRRWHDPRTMTPHRWSSVPQAWARLIEASRDLEPRGVAVLLHRDFHPGNVLWHEGRVTGIVDWPNACRGIAALDAGHCRRDLVMTHGVDTAESFLAAYREASGRAPDPLCDAITLLDHGGTESLDAYHAMGRTDLTVDLVRARLDEYATVVAGRL